jgi:sugar phosphate isomerase/epimerase
MYLSFNARALGLRLSAAETLELASAAGFAGVDLLLRDLVEAGESVPETRSRLVELGLRGGAWPLVMDWKGEEAAYRRSLAELPRYAAIAAELGLTRTGTWVLPELGGRFADQSWEGGVEWHLDRLGPIVEILREHGIRLGLEVIGVESFRVGDGVRFMTRIEELGPLIEPLRRLDAGVGVLVDSYHLFAAGEGAEAACRWGLGSPVWVHLADVPADFGGDRGALVDGKRGLPGEGGGAIDFVGLRRVVEDAGYNGPVTVEPLGWRPLDTVTTIELARRVRTSVRRVWER